MNVLISIFRIPELAKKIGFTLLFLMIYRVAYFVPLPVVDLNAMQEKMQNMAGPYGQLIATFSLFSGGNLSQASIIALGIMPYISASIILQLLASVYPPLEKLKKEGESGVKKINEYTRYLTVPICMIQSIFVVRSLILPEDRGGMGLAAPGLADDSFGTFYLVATAVLTMTAGTLFLMWIGEQIDEYGIGNGISLIIMAGIVARIPDATWSLLFDSRTGGLRSSIFRLGGDPGEMTFEKLIVLAILFIAVVVAVVAMTKAQRRIPTQSARHVRGRRVFGASRQYLPLKVNQAGVMPVIFASSLLIVPSLMFNYLDQSLNSPVINWLHAGFFPRAFLYNVLYVALIYFFCYFWTGITFNPKDVANNLKDFGSFIPGYRPGKRTAEYLDRVVMRITFVGAAFLAVVAIIPTIIQTQLSVPQQVAAFYGGTGLLIVVSVVLDLVQKINTHLVMRNYPGLTDES
jgi:preprotein translocase subunit SecY